MSKTNEMINLPIINVPPMGSVGNEVPAEIEYDGETTAGDETIVVGSPGGVYAPGDITVYASTITPVSFGVSDASTASFDVVFSVGINCGAGVCKTYQVVKRIGIDKCRIAAQAESSTPVSIVETKAAEKLAESAAITARFRRLAGLE